MLYSRHLANAATRQPRPPVARLRALLARMQRLATQPTGELTNTALSEIAFRILFICVRTTFEELLTILRTFVIFNFTYDGSIIIIFYQNMLLSALFKVISCKTWLIHRGLAERTERVSRSTDGAVVWR